MKAETALELLTPGELEVAKQDWRRDPSTWRSRFKSVVRPDLRASYDEMADALERHFEELPQWKPRVNSQGHRY